MAVPASTTKPPSFILHQYFHFHPTCIFSVCTDYRINAVYTPKVQRLSINFFCIVSLRLVHRPIPSAPIMGFLSVTCKWLQFCSHFVLKHLLPVTYCDCSTLLPLHFITILFHCSLVSIMTKLELIATYCSLHMYEAMMST